MGRRAGAGPGEGEGFQAVALKAVDLNSLESGPVGCCHSQVRYGTIRTVLSHDCAELSMNGFGRYARGSGGYVRLD